MRLEGSVCLVTGAASGIGRATVGALERAELARALLPGMVARGRGHVVNVVPARPARSSDSSAGRTRLSVPAVVETSFFAERGAAYGRRWPRPVPPERIANAIVDAIGRDRARVVVPAWLGVAVRLHGAAPRSFRALADRLD